MFKQANERLTARAWKKTPVAMVPKRDVVAATPPAKTPVTVKSQEPEMSPRMQHLYRVSAGLGKRTQT